MKNLKLLVITCCVSLVTILAFSACDQNATTKESSKTKTDVKVTQMKAKIDADSAYNFVKKQVDFGFRVPGTPEHAACADWLETTLKQYADEVTMQKAMSGKNNGLRKPLPIYNVIGSFNPKSSKRILLCAHWDSRWQADQDVERQKEPIYGANDGGSGVGVLLEIARQLKLKPLQNIGVDIVLFDTEDQGESGITDSYCLGAQHWAKTARADGYQADFGILLDMVGAGDAVFLKEGISRNYAGAVVDKVWHTALELGYNKHFVNKNTSEITDDHVYVNMIAGVPTIDIIHFDPTQYANSFGDFWHTHDDDMSVINKYTLRAVGNTVLTVVYREDMAL
ncbi:MAG: M28 family peptidase [Chitinophagales bacterium]